MRNLILSGILTIAVFSGCSPESDNGSCCKGMDAQSKSIVAPTPVKPNGNLDYQVKSDDPIARPAPVASITPPAVNPAQPTKTPAPVEPKGKPVVGANEGDPVAVISGPNGQTLKADKRVHFSCAKSYDTDEQGHEIVSCEWKFECHKKDGYTCNCPKKGNINIDVSIKPHPNADYMIAHLTVTDDEGVTNTTTIRYDIVQ